MAWGAWSWAQQSASRTAAELPLDMLNRQALGACCRPSGSIPPQPTAHAIGGALHAKVVDGDRLDQGARVGQLDAQELFLGALAGQQADAAWREQRGVQ